MTPAGGDRQPQRAPMTRYFPEVVEALLANFPERAVLDGEIIVANLRGQYPGFRGLQQRIHPAASRVKMLSGATPASFVAFDLLAIGEDNQMNTPSIERRAALQQALADAQPPIHITPATQDVVEAQRWFEEVEGAGLDGLIAKKLDLRSQPDKRGGPLPIAGGHRRAARRGAECGGDRLAADRRVVRGDAGRHRQSCCPAEPGQQDCRCLPASPRTTRRSAASRSPPHSAPRRAARRWPPAIGRGPPRLSG